jgi:hypothetical protein
MSTTFSIMLIILAPYVLIRGVLYGCRYLYVPRHAALEVEEAALWAGGDLSPHIDEPTVDRRPLRVALYVLQGAGR